MITKKSRVRCSPRWLYWWWYVCSPFCYCYLQLSPSFSIHNDSKSAAGCNEQHVCIYISLISRETAFLIFTSFNTPYTQWEIGSVVMPQQHFPSFIAFFSLVFVKKTCVDIIPNSVEWKSEIGDQDGTIPLICCFVHVISLCAYHLDNVLSHFRMWSYPCWTYFLDTIQMITIRGWKLMFPVSSLLIAFPLLLFPPELYVQTMSHY